MFLTDGGLSGVALALNLIHHCCGKGSQSCHGIWLPSCAEAELCASESLSGKRQQVQHRVVRS